MDATDTPPRLSAWRIRALDRHEKLSFHVEQARLRIERLPASGPDRQEGETALARMDAWLAAAQRAAGGPPAARETVANRWRGSDIDAAWSALHRIEAALVEITPDETAYKPVLTSARERARQRLRARDARLTALARAEHPVDAEKKLLAPGTMRMAASVLGAALADSDDRHRRIRSFRNLLIVTTLGTLGLGFLLALVGALAPAWIDLCWTVTEPAGEACPTGGSAPSPGDVALVELIGLLGAAVASAFGIRRLRGTSTPYAVPLMSLIIKLPLGALTAVLGLLLLHLFDSFVITSQQELAAYALIFGVSQEAFTQLIDRQAHSVLSSVRPGAAAEPDDPAASAP